MTVSKLIEELKKMPDDLPVVLHADWSSAAELVFEQIMSDKTRHVVISE